MKVVYTGDEAPTQFTKSIFLAGPTPRNKEEVESWRPDALKILEDKGYDGVVFVPEDKDREFKKDYDDQIEWEERYLNMADCIVFWVPRDLSLDSTGFPKMAAFTTNVEWGTWASSGKVVFGAPEDAEKVSYLKHYAEKYNVPTGETLTETLEFAMEMVGEGDGRTEGEREVPLYIWKTDSFQSWYLAQKKAGNRLDHARVMYNFRPRNKDFVWMWVLKTDMYVESEDRHKTNELVITRTDISSVCMWFDTGGESIYDDLVVLVREYRSPSSTEDGFIRELPGGSAPTSESPEETAANEVHEETGFYLDPSRLKFHCARQLAGTFSAHKSHLFSVKLTSKEIDWFSAQHGVQHGNVEDSERTFIEVYSVQELVDNQLVDWTTLGMILQVMAD